MKHILLVGIFFSLTIQNVVGAEQTSRVDDILIQINGLSEAEQTELMKKLIAQKTDQAIADAKEKVAEMKQQLKEKINDPKYQKHLNKAKKKLKKLYDLFRDEDETPAEPPTQAI